MIDLWYLTRPRTFPYILYLLLRRLLIFQSMTALMPMSFSHIWSIHWRHWFITAWRRVPALSNHLGWQLWITPRRMQVRIEFKWNSSSIILFWSWDVLFINILTIIIPFRWNDRQIDLDLQQDETGRYYWRAHWNYLWSRCTLTHMCKINIWIHTINRFVLGERSRYQRYSFPVV